MREGTEKAVWGENIEFISECEIITVGATDKLEFQIYLYTENVKITRLIILPII